jgi:hypothetical protein
MIELLVVIVIIGVLVSLLLPAVNSSREATRRVMCQNNLRQISLATISFAEVKGAFPPARLEPALDAEPGNACGGEHPSWMVRVLPFMEESATFVEWDVNSPYDTHSESLRNRTVSTFICPTRRTADEAIVPSRREMGMRYSSCGCGTMVFIRILGGATGDYAGNHGDPSPGAVGGPDDFYRGGNGTGVIISSRALCDGDRPVTWVDKVKHQDLRDGTSKTFLVGESHVTPDSLLESPFDGPIYNGENLAAFARIGGPGVPLARNKDDQPGPILGFGSWHPGICNFALADGSVRAIDNLIDSSTLANLCHRADGKY